MKLTPPQVELLTDIATKPQMYVGIWGPWGRTARALARRGLAGVEDVDHAQAEVTITEDGKAEAIRRGIIQPPVTFLRGVRCGGCSEILPDQEIASDCACDRVRLIECACPDANLQNGIPVSYCPRHGDDAQANEDAAIAREPYYGQPRGGFWLACPGADEYGHGLTAKAVHAGGCCQRFMRLSDDERLATGLKMAYAA